MRVFVKRDDLIHPEVMGNKWRKLKYNLLAAKQKGYRKVVTLGGAYSNHIAATAAAARLMGFESYGIIRGEELHRDSNSTLQKAYKDGMRFQFVSRTSYRTLRSDASAVCNAHSDCYFIPEGGTNELAIKGAAEVIPEIAQPFDYLFCPVGTGGTFCGLLASAEAHQKIVGISSLKGSFIHQEIDRLLARFRIANKNYQLVTDYHFGGYGKVDRELIDFMAWFEETFSIELDPIYTAKCFFAVWDMISKESLPKNLKIVLLHTGGLQGNQGVYRKN